MAETYSSSRTGVRPDEPATSSAFVVHVQWGSVIAGAIAGAALAFVLHSFAAGVGLAVSSTAPTWRDSSAALWFLSGIYLLLVAIASYGLAGYVTARMRERQTAASDEAELRDGMHGLIAWALATLITGALIAAALPAASRLLAPSAGSAGPAASVGGENLLAYDLDRLFRAERQPGGGFDMNLARAEAARILLTSAGRNGVSPDDRTYLARLTGEITGLMPQAAAQRVDQVIAGARTDIRRARHASVIIAFFAGAAALVGAAIAWYAAEAGGRQRDGNAAPWGTIRREAARYGGTR